MFIETMKIRKSGNIVGATLAANERILRKPRVLEDGRIHTRIGDPNWHQDPGPEDVYIGIPHALNTKFVANVTEHPVIGSIVEMSNGTQHHLDVTAAELRIEGNRR